MCWADLSAPPSKLLTVLWKKIDTRPIVIRTRPGVY
jgi:hypothetical protein